VKEQGGPDVAVISGDGSPPAAILWDGRLLDGTWARSGMRYTYTFTLQYPDSSSLCVPGEDFVLSSYVREEAAGVTFLFAAAGETSATLPDLTPDDTAATASDPTGDGESHLRRAAAILNRRAFASSPVTIEVLAREEDRARACGESLRRALAAMMATMDDGIGAVLDILRARGIGDNIRDGCRDSFHSCLEYSGQT